MCGVPTASTLSLSTVRVSLLTLVPPYRHRSLQPQDCSVEYNISFCNGPEVWTCVLLVISGKGPLLSIQAASLSPCFFPIPPLPSFLTPPSPPPPLLSLPLPSLLYPQLPLSPLSLPLFISLLLYPLLHPLLPHPSSLASDPFPFPPFCFKCYPELLNCILALKPVRRSLSP